MRIYGPYTRKDGRKHICIVHSNGRKQTKSYPRYVLERHLGRELLPEETVDHIDDDFTNDSVGNLQILTREDNARKYTALTPRKLYYFTCPVCGRESVKFLNYVLGNWKKGKQGPYCSRQCSGKRHN